VENKYDTHGTQVLAQTHQFNQLGLETALIDAAQNQVTYAYGDQKNPYQITNMTDKDGKSVSYTYDQFGNVTSYTDMRNVVTTYSYSYATFALGRLMSIQRGALTPVTLTYYEPTGLLQSVTAVQPGSTTQQTVTTTFTYDSLGNVLTVVAPGNNTVQTITTTFNYTTDGTYTQPDAIGQPILITDNLGHQIHCRYDTQGNLLAAIDAIGNETDLTYNIADQLISAIGPATGQTGTGHAKAIRNYLYPGSDIILSSLLYDESGNTAQQVNQTYDFNGNILSQSGNTLAANLNYDGLDRVVKATDGNNHATSYIYDLVGHLTNVRYPDGDTVQLTSFDAVGRVLSLIDGNNNTMNYQYNDQEGKLTNISFPSAPAQNIVCGYDMYGRPQTLTDATGVTSYVYDELSNELSVNTTFTGLPEQTISYSYYPDGSRAGMTMPVGNFSYNYDGAERMTSLTNPFGKTAGWQYQNNNWLAQQTLGNNAITSYVYNPLGLLTSLTNNDANNNQLSAFSGLTYDSRFNNTGLTASVTGQASFSGGVSYSNDGIGQLLNEQSQRGTAYNFSSVFDAAGNATTFRGQSQTVNADNQLTAAGSSYDGNGNPTLYRNTALGYDLLNHLTQYGTALTAGYNGVGQRAWKSNGTTQTYFLYDCGVPVCELQANAGQLAVSAVNTFGPNGLLARNEIGGRELWYQFDGQGNVAQRLDANAHVLSTDMYDGWGNLQAGGDTSDPFGYNAQYGYYTDHETGLVLCTNRYYDPQTGRWINRDPIGDMGGWNLYAYCGGNPTNAADPSGWCPDSGDTSLWGSIGIWWHHVGHWCKDFYANAQLCKHIPPQFTSNAKAYANFYNIDNNIENGTMPETEMGIYRPMLRTGAHLIKTTAINLYGVGDANEWISAVTGYDMEGVKGDDKELAISRTTKSLSMVSSFCEKLKLENKFIKSIKLLDSGINKVEPFYNCFSIINEVFNDLYGDE
jgi:RHS repeat-associated protein